MKTNFACAVCGTAYDLCATLIDGKFLRLCVKHDQAVRRHYATPCLRRHMTAAESWTLSFFQDDVAERRAEEIGRMGGGG